MATAFGHFSPALHFNRFAHARFGRVYQTMVVPLGKLQPLIVAKAITK